MCPIPDGVLWLLLYRATIESGRSIAMKFANKYELFEAVTRGRVETFVSKELASGARVLFHIFEAPEQKPDQPTVQWVVESFRTVAPRPPGLVVEAGRYSGTTYAYLVTKFADDAALQRWIQSYESFVVKPRELATEPQAISPEDPSLSKDLSEPNDRPDNDGPDEVVPTPSADPSLDITVEFSVSASRVHLPPRANTSEETGPHKINVEPEPAIRREPSDFTREFFSGSPESPPALATQAPIAAEETKALPQREIVPNRTDSREPSNKEGNESPRPAPTGGGLTEGSANLASPDPGGFTAMFQSGFRAETNSTSGSVGAPRKPDDLKAGGFTDFFRGPFDGERPAETPNILLPEEAPPRNAPGEFTRMFGSGKDGSFALTPPFEGPVRDPHSEPDPGADTQVLRVSTQPAAPPPANVPARTWEPMSSNVEISPPSKEPRWTAPPAPVPPQARLTPPDQPVLPEQTVSSTIRDAGPPLQHGATRIFSVPSAGPLSSATPLQTGPSEYTRIISGGMKDVREQAPIASGSPNPPGGSGFKMPAAPVFPPVPAFAAPPPLKLTPPTIAAPLAPPIPQLGIKEPAFKASHLPLVIILTVLLLFAVLLIAYFAVKH
jgi:hypothetical protein